MAKVTSNGVEIDYERVGDGPPILLVHGFASSKYGNWNQSGWYDFLTGAGREVIALDCRGHGRSGKPHESAAYDGSQMADDVLAVMDAAAVEKADLMGYSMGGGISLALVTREPSRFNSVVIGGAGANVGADPARRQSIAAALRAPAGEGIESRTAFGFRRFAQQSNNDLEALAAVMSSDRAMGADDNALAALRLPTLVVVGDQDEALPGARRLASLVPDAELIVLRGKNHLSAVGDAHYKEAVGRFLDTHSPRQRD